jgi:hypothetical protein
MAIYHGLGESYALTLIERASEETLCAVDIVVLKAENNNNDCISTTFCLLGTGGFSGTVCKLLDQVTT